jgi:UDP-N-acetyl-D-glucosamine dehydrogenase
MKVSIIGQGYVGLSLAIAAEKTGQQVVGFDVNSDLVKQLQSEISHVEGVDSSELLSARNYVPTSDASQIEGSDIVIIAVPTPLDENRKPDLSYLNSACQIIAENLKNKALIINESTSFPGTLRDLISAQIEKASGLGHLYAASPERVDPGNLLWNQANTPRLVAGLTEEATKKAAEFYLSFCANVITVSSPEVAEAAKLFENTFRQVNIAMVNELAQISHGLDIDVREVLDAAATKPFGFMKFNPSLGVGGHCIPVDPSYLSFAAENAGIEASFIDLANEINLEMPSYVANRIANEVGGLKGKKVLVAGLSYKANVSDLRESPSLLLIDALEVLGAEVIKHDPLIAGTSGIVNCDVAILAVAHDAIDKDALKNCAPYVFDCTGVMKNEPGVNGL